MREGNPVKEKRENLVERYTTRKGLWDFFLGGGIGGFIIIKYNQNIFQFFVEFFSFTNQLPFGNLVQQYLSYLGFWTAMSFLGLGITIALSHIYDLVFKGR